MCGIVGGEGGGGEDWKKYRKLIVMWVGVVGGWKNLENLIAEGGGVGISFFPLF